MLRIFLILLQNYGLDALQLGLIGFCFWKLFSNHLKHLLDDVKGNSKQIKDVAKNVKKTNEDIGEIKGRVSKIEGKIGL